MKKIVSWLLVSVMLLTSVDATALAAGVENVENVNIGAVNAETVSDSNSSSESVSENGTVPEEEGGDNAAEEETGLGPVPEENNEETIEQPADNILGSISENDVTQKETAVSLEVTAFDVTDSGKCGDNLTWTLQDGVLTISGTGEMNNYYARYDLDGVCYSSAPWYSYVEQIQKLVISEGVTSIGMEAFAGCKYITGKWEIPSSVKTICYQAFKDCTGYTGDLVIPDTVTEIEWGAFSGCTGFNGNLVISKGLTVLSGNIFTNCNFTGNLTIPEGVTIIESGAFAYCSGFTGNLVIPDSVTEIGYRAFRDCSGLNGTLQLGKRLAVIGQEAFYGCDFRGNLVLPDGLRSIKDSAFDGCRGFIGDLEIPDSVTTIGKAAFINCSGFDGRLILPDSIEIIEQSAFRDCSGFTGDLVIPDSVKIIDNSAFSGWNGNHGTLSIGKNVTTIADSAFYGSSGFSGDLVIPDSVITIERHAFYGCNGFGGSLQLGSSLMTIGYGAFQECSKLSGDLVLGINVVTIEYSAFVGCNGFSGKAYVPASVTSIESIVCDTIYGESGSYAETYANSKGITFIPYSFGIERVMAPIANPVSGSEIEAGSAIALMSETAGAKIYYTIDGTAPSILDSTCYEEEISIFDAVTISAFAVKPGYQNSEIVTFSYTVAASDHIVGGTCGASVKWSLNRETGVLSIYGNGEMEYFDTEGGLFERKSKAPWMEYENDIKRLEIKRGVTSIGGHAFEGCSGIKGELVLPEGLEEIGDFAFNRCSGFTGSLIIPQGVTSIGQKAFGDCTGFNGDLIISDSVKTMKLAAFSGCSGFKGKLQLPDGIEIIENDTFWECSGFTGSLVIPDSVVQIKTYAFRDCSGFTGDLKIPEEVVYIGNGAFGNCLGLEGYTVTLGDKVRTIGSNAFSKLLKPSYKYAPLDLTIQCNPGTYAEKWAKENGFIKEIKVVMPVMEYTYTGQQIKPEVQVYHDSRLLVQGKDYKVTYKNNINAEDKTASGAPYVSVTGIGNYSGKTSNKTFTIKPKEITADIIQSQEILLNGNGKVRKPSPTIKVDGKKLTKNKDYTLSYPDTAEGAYKAAGTWNITVTGKGNYTGETTVTFRILDETEVQAAKLTVGKIASVKYEEGQKAEPKPAISYKGTKLVEGEDYSLTYSSNEKAGKATLTITGLEKDGKISVVGTTTKTFTITGTAISKAKAEYEKLQPYTGSQICPEVKLTMDKGATTLREGTDYTLSYDTNTKAGKGTIIITGMGGYTGTVKKTFTIQPVNMTDTEQDIRIEFNSGRAEAAYAVSGAKPAVIVYCGETELIPGTDYTVSYKNNKKTANASDKKAPAVTVKGKGNYKGTKSQTFSILAKDLTDSDITVSAPDKVYNAKGKHQSAPVITDGDGKKLKAGRDYKILGYYVNGEELPAVKDIPVGTEVTIKIQGSGSYQKETETTYRIVQRDLSKAAIKINPVEYTGDTITFSAEDFTNGNIKVTGPKGVTAPVYGTDFMISEYKNNTNKGTAQVTFKGISNEWGGSKTVTFKIAVKKMK